MVLLENRDSVWLKTEKARERKFGGGLYYHKHITFGICIPIIFFIPGKLTFGDEKKNGKRSR